MLSWLRNTPHFMETYKSLSFQQPCCGFSFSAKIIQSAHFHTIFKIHFNIIATSMYKSSKFLFPSCFPTKILHVFLVYPTPSTCLVNLILIHLNILLILCELYKPWNLSVCSFLQSPVLIGSNISLKPYSLKPTDSALFLSVRDQVSHPYKMNRKIINFY